MKYTHILFILFQFISFSLFGNGEPVSYDTEVPLIDHLISINKEWTKQKDVPTHLMTIPIKFNSDEERIQLHLQFVEKTLKARSADHLTIQQFINRNKNLESLMSYWKEGQFPINTHHSHRQPYFIDDFGTACAVGHLLLTSGEEDLAHYISDVQNYAYIHEMNYPKLNEWTSENGFTKDELAWIQPGYDEYICYSVEHVSGVEYIEDNQPLNQQEIKTMMTLNVSNNVIFGGNFLHYDTANGTQTASVFEYDGNNYISYGNAIQGTVYDIEYYNDLIYVAGDFVLAGTNFYNIAYWDGLQWIGVQTGNMNGIIRDMVSYECELYVGGDFTTVNGATVENIAIWNGAAWSTMAQNCSGQQAAQALGVNGTVNALEVYHRKLAIGGDFTGVSGNATPVEGLIFWNNQTLEFLPTHGSMTSVSNLESYESALIVGGDNLYAYRWNKWYYPGDSIRQQELDYIENSYLGYWNIPDFTGINDIFYIPPIFPQNPNFVEYANLIISTNNEVHAINSKQTQVGYAASHSVDYCLSVDGTVSALGWGNFKPYYAGNFNTVTINEGLGHNSCEHVSDAEKTFSLRREIFLPIELAEFTVKSTDNKTAQLKWTSLTESNSLHYEIERKTNNEDFTRVGTVTAAGESVDKIDYTFEDDISIIKGGHVYYRLKMVDKDGSFEYSDIRSLKLSDFDSTVSVYPNPAEDVVAISMEMPWTGNLAVNIYNLKSQLVNTYQWTYDTNLVVNEQIDISHLQTGLYLVEVVSPQERITKKLDIIK